MRPQLTVVIVKGEQGIGLDLAKCPITAQAYVVRLKEFSGMQ
jgi:hypothetical protein